ncbi:DUF882 domain-containing protein [Methylocystis sp. WRRC1]|uniref:DUF882 domain-containing protein n=1 Tax=Methylocystis sp. WRRC1 TaxID=1732014 RepID=UPI001D135947|nr:DUF882 domain-containing protein [Methylocystis sp. WRRC1]MCC3244709.1 DUF882 domain-containing protein [Methylocystis sp. WRRC1]
MGAIAACIAAFTPSLTETAIANGDTRTIYLHHAHTGEDIAATYLVNGQYDSNVLRQLNWFLRDWRRDEPTNMDPRLFDVVWEAYRTAGAGNQVINVVSAYRSPETNAMLRSRSRAVAKYSQHMLGKAMDTTMPGMPMSHIREIGMRMQRGGVGYYPTAGTPFVHLDVGNVRSWPRMTYDQLVRLFPDGKTVHLPTNGQPLARYEEARAEIEARGNGAYVTAPRRTVGGFFAMLFGVGGGEEDDSEVAAPPPSTRKQWASLAPRNGRGAKMAETDEEGGGAPAAEAATDRRGRGQQLARAEENLPRGETAMSSPGVTAMATPAAEPAPERAQEPQEKERPAPTVRVPLPPSGRPASLASKPTPLEPEDRGTAVAALETGAQPDLRNSLEQQEAESVEAGSTRVYAKVPLPPHRPSMLVAAVTAAPLPPARPSALQKSASGRGADANAAHAIANLVDEGKGAGSSAKRTDDEPLAYVAPPLEKNQDAEAAKTQKPAAAKTEQRTVARRSDFVPARLDRSNFNTLTGATPTSRASARSVTGAPIGAVRAAARAAEPSVLAPPQRPSHIVGFASPDATPPTDKFAPGAQRGR